MFALLIRKKIVIFLCLTGLVLELNSCFSNSKSNDQLIQEIVFDVKTNKNSYRNFSNYVSRMKDSIHWDSLQIFLSKNGINNSENPKFEFNTYDDIGILITSELGREYSFGGNTLEYLKNNKNDNLFKNYLNGVDLEFSTIDSIIKYANEIEESEFTLYKDGTVIILRLICFEIDNCTKYEIIYPSSRMLISGECTWLKNTNFYIGVHGLKCFN